MFRLVTAVAVRVTVITTSTDYVSCRQPFLGKKKTYCVDNLLHALAVDLLIAFLDPVYAGTPKKFVSTVRPKVYTDPSGKRNFSKALFNPRNLKTPAFRFRADGQHFENGAFRKRWCLENQVISLPEVSANTIPTRPMIVAFSNFCGVLSTENIWCVFRVMPPLSNSPGVVWTGRQ